mgnify:FL=1
MILLPRRHCKRGGPALFPGYGTIALYTRGLSRLKSPCLGEFGDFSENGLPRRPL